MTKVVLIPNEKDGGKDIYHLLHIFINEPLFSILALFFLIQEGCELLQTMSGRDELIYRRYRTNKILSCRILSN